MCGLLFLSGTIVGTDGARQQQRHEQTSDILRYGGLGAFLTANLADTRHPIVVLLYAGALNGDEWGGVDDDGKMQRFAIDLLDECPQMPKYEEMLRIVARDPVALARFFILAERLFCEHILGTGLWDRQLRHHGRKGGVFP